MADPTAPSGPTPIKQARELQGRPQHDVARAARVDQAQLSRAERGMGALSIDSLYRIVVVLGMRREQTALEPYLWDKSLLDHSSWLVEDDPPDPLGVGEGSAAEAVGHGVAPEGEADLPAHDRAELEA